MLLSQHENCFILILSKDGPTHAGLSYTCVLLAACFGTVCCPSAASALAHGGYRMSEEIRLLPVTSKRNSAIMSPFPIPPVYRRQCTGHRHQTIHIKPWACSQGESAARGVFNDTTEGPRAGREGRIRPIGAVAWMVTVWALRSPPIRRSFSGKRQMPITRSVSGSGSAAASSPGPARVRLRE
jgi:hypothetical protein